MAKETKDNHWYWVRFDGLDGLTEWTPAQRKGNHWTSVSFRGIPDSKMEVGAEITFPEPNHMQWPKGREAGRMGDMEPMGQSHLRIGLDADNDVYVSVFNGREQAVASIEFCNGGSGGGRSLRTRIALIGAMVAMEADSAESPELAFPKLSRAAENMKASL